MARNFLVERPEESDASRIAEIHLAAMHSNPLLHVQFPSPESLKALQQFLTKHTAEQLRDPASGVLVARDPETNVIVAFVKWTSPSHPENTNLESGDLRDLEGCRREYLDRYAALAEEAKMTCFGDKPCYRTWYPAFPSLPLSELSSRGWSNRRVGRSSELVTKPIVGPAAGMRKPWSCSAPGPNPPYS
jgi:hypothetical protein